MTDSCAYGAPMTYFLSAGRTIHPDKVKRLPVKILFGKPIFHIAQRKSVHQSVKKLARLKKTPLMVTTLSP